MSHTIHILLGAFLEWLRNIKTKADIFLSGMSYKHYHHHDQ